MSAAVKALRRRAIQRAWNEYQAEARRLDLSNPSERRQERKAWNRLHRHLRDIDARYS